jgi:inorganic pyrophosphatase
MKVRPIGALAVVQREVGDTVRNAVPAQAERMTKLSEIDDLGADTLRQLEVLLRETDEWEEKEIKFLGWKRAPREAAHRRGGARRVYSSRTGFRINKPVHRILIKSDAF